jgi:RNA polymerase sigma factor (sigma-70 family)
MDADFYLRLEGSRHASIQDVISFQPRHPSCKQVLFYIEVKVDDAHSTMKGLNMKKQHSWEDLNNLFVKAREMHEDAKEELFEFLRLRLLILARHRVSEAAEDTVQETLIIIHNRFSEFETLQGLLAFMHQVLRNKIGNIYQSRSREQNRQVELDNVSESRYYTDWDMGAVEMERIVRTAIDKLGEERPHCRSILFCLYQGLEPGEISDRLEITKSKLKVQTFRCREALKKILVSVYGLQV